MSQKAVSERKREFRGSKWYVDLLCIHRTDTFLQGQQRFVDLSSLHSPLTRIRLGVMSSFGTCQIAKYKLPTELPISVYVNLTNSMASRAGIVRNCAVSSSCFVTEFYHFVHFFWATDDLFLNSLNLYLVMVKKS